MDFLVELTAFLRSRWQQWVRPLVIAVLILTGVLVLASGVARVLAPASEDSRMPVSRSDYRHDAAWFNRY